MTNLGNELELCSSVSSCQRLLGHRPTVRA